MSEVVNLHFYLKMNWCVISVVVPSVVDTCFDAQIAQEVKNFFNSVVFSEILRNMVVNAISPLVSEIHKLEKEVKAL